MMNTTTAALSAATSTLSLITDESVRRLASDGLALAAAGETPVVLGGFTARLLAHGNTETAQGLAVASVHAAIRSAIPASAHGGKAAAQAVSYAQRAAAV